MKHYVEIQTVHRDGSETWQRWECPDYPTALLEARIVAIAGFCCDVDASTELFNSNRHPWCENDFGEPACVRARSYGHAAQVRVGTFTVFDWEGAP